MITFRSIHPDEVEATTALLASAFGWSPDGSEIIAFRRAHEHGDLATTLAAFHADVLIGFVEYQPVEIHIGQQTVRGATGINLAVEPQWRRRRVATQLMDRQLEQLNHNGIALYAGSVANVSLMRSLGWEFGSMVLRYELHTEELAEQLHDLPASGHAEVLDTSHIPDLSVVYHRSVADRFGAFARTQSWWEHRILTNPDRQRARNLIGWRSTQDHVDGYTIIEPQHDSVQIVELHARSHDSYVGLLRHLASVHRGSCLRWSAPADDPLPLLVRQPYRLRPRLEPDKMFRIVHVGTVLNAAVQSGRAPASVTVAIRDEHATWNARTWRVGHHPGGDGSVIPVDATPDIVVPVGDIVAMIGGLPTKAPRYDGHPPCVDLAEMLRPRMPAYCREDL